MFKIALQLYSLKDQCAADLDAALEGVKKAGYDGVETYNLLGLSAAEFRKKLDSAGLACSSMHVGIDSHYEDLDKVISDALALGAETVVIPWTQLKSEAEVIDFAGFVKENAAKFSSKGLKWLYHNHAHEFEILDKGRDFIEILLAHTGSEQINLQADTYWIEKGGAELAAFIEKAKPRIGGFHLKDDREVGAGKIDFAGVLKAAAELGHKWLVVEQEEFDIDPFESIRLSRDNISRILGK